MYLAGHEPRILHEDMLEELEKARIKFPTRPEQDNEDLLAMLAALNEEVGEVNKAIIEYLYEPHKGVTIDNIREEIAQTGGMLLRLAFDTKLGNDMPYGRGS